MSEQTATTQSEYYRLEAERVQRLAEAAQPGHGREIFAEVAAEYRTLADYYEALPPLEPELTPAPFPTH